MERYTQWENIISQLRRKDQEADYGLLLQEVKGICRFLKPEDVKVFT